MGTIRSCAVSAAAALLVGGLTVTTLAPAAGAATPVAAQAAASAAPATIKYGDRSWSVICLQQGLNYLAWTTGGRVRPAGSVDGIFGRQTLGAVRSLQVFNSRRQTGVVDRTSGEDLAEGLWRTQGNAQNIKDWLRYCQHTIPRYTNFPAY